MAEWLRRWTRNPMGYSRTGSNPVHSAALFYVSKISFFPPKNIYFSFFFCKRGWHCWCSGIIQDSHSWDLGSIPRQCRKPTYFFHQKTWLVSSKYPYFPGSTQIWTGDLSICSRMLYHWAIPPCPSWPKFFLEIQSRKPAILNSKSCSREHPDLNWGPLDLQSNALPLSYTPNKSFASLKFSYSFRPLKCETAWHTDNFLNKKKIHSTCRSSTWHWLWWPSG